jgi:hypothetical protein
MTCGFNLSEWRLLKLIRIGEWVDTEADNEAGGEFAYPSAQPIGS